MADSAATMGSSRLHVVSGKGGTGKTTVAAAMALALASAATRPGHDGRVLLAEVEGRQGLAQLFDQPPLGPDPAPLDVAPGGGEVHGLAVDIEHAFLSYLDHLLGGLRRTRPLLRRLGAVEFATEVMPGLRDLLLIDPVVTAVQDRTAGRPRWDAVVLDAPPTGRIARFLSVAAEVGSLSHGGRLAAQARAVLSVLRSPASAVHLVALPEPMPVEETRDAAGELRDLGFPLGLVVANRTDLHEPRLGAVDAGRLRAAGAAGGVALDEATVAGLVAEGAAAAGRRRLEEAEIAALRALGQPLVVLPRLAGGVDPGGLYELADALRPVLAAGSGR